MFLGKKIIKGHPFCHTTQVMQLILKEKQLQKSISLSLSPTQIGLNWVTCSMRPCSFLLQTERPTWGWQRGWEKKRPLKSLSQVNTLSQSKLLWKRKCFVISNIIPSDRKSHHEWKFCIFFILTSFAALANNACKIRTLTIRQGQLKFQVSFKPNIAYPTALYRYRHSMSMKFHQTSSLV